MYLRAIEIQGFKSFADKTRLSFEKNITAIVGPNGSGKSNIADAVLWVMGEQSSKALRGTKMEDVIFGGTQKRSPLGFAQVSLILDNSARIFDCEGSEVMLTRRYYRSGESEYFINRESVRLKDIHSLLMDTGLGRDGYSIIGQGRIAEIVSNKSTDRREVFEEAAGISRFRYRKEEAERKLDRTEENLLRINDKIEELEMQVGPLREQSKVAKRYLSLREELKTLEISVWMESLDKLRANAESIRQEYDQAKAAAEKAKDELEALYASSNDLSERMRRKDIETEQARDALSEAEAEAARQSSEIALLRSEAENTRRNRDRLLADLAGQENRAAELQMQTETGEARLCEIDAELVRLENENKKISNLIESQRIKIKTREDRTEALGEKYNRLTVDGRSMDSRIRMLTEMEKDYEGYSRAVKTVMREAGRKTLRGIHAPVANLVQTDEDYALAIETALGAAAQNIVADTMEDGRAAIELLKRTDAGRATFLPVDTIRGSVMRDAPVNDEGFVGVAFDLVRFDQCYEQIMANLLGRTVVAETLADAVRMSKRSGSRLRIVTLDGQLINAGGSMTGGSSAKGTGVISRANELQKLKMTRLRLADNEKSCGAELEKARKELASLRYQLELSAAEQTELKAAVSSLEAEKRTSQNALSQLRLLLESMTGESRSHHETLRSYEDRISRCTDELARKQEELLAVNNRVRAAREEIAAVSQSRMELEARRTGAEKEAQRRSADIIDLERVAARIEQKKLSADMEEKQLLDKLWDSYELSHSAAMTLRQPVESLPKANRRLGELRREIASLGSPNLGAIEEYERVNTRYEFLTAQRDDVEKAKNELVDIIKDITGEMETLFVERFRAIDESFRTTFLELFGGGKAALVLEDENDVLGCGIDIKVQPPGKSLSTISLLSGGEMAFVAIALYFAILKVRPTPFCVMDEIEAALDEANVVRYAEYMRRMADKTQFLVITHRRGTMEEADMLYGVTMQEKGVSTVIELDLEKAEKTLEE